MDIAKFLLIPNSGLFGMPNKVVNGSMVFDIDFDIKMEKYMEELKSKFSKHVDVIDKKIYVKNSNDDLTYYTKIIIHPKKCVVGDEFCEIEKNIINSSIFITDLEDNGDVVIIDL